MLNVKKVIILAGGRAMRLRPITKNKPKCLLEIAGKTIISRQIELLSKHGVIDFIIVTGFKSKMLTNFLLKNHGNTNFTFINNEKYSHTGPAYGLWLAKDFLNDTVLYLNSDVIFSDNLISEIINSPEDSVTAVINNFKSEGDFVRVSIDKDGQISKIGKNIPIENCDAEFIGATKLGKIFNTSLIQALNDFYSNNEFNKFAVDAIDLAINRYKGNIKTLQTNRDNLVEIDTVADFNDARKKIYE